jgi:hypothetical protein
LYCEPTQAHVSRRTRFLCSLAVVAVVAGAAGLGERRATAQTASAESANAAYAAGRFSDCAVAWQAVAKSGGSISAGDALYNAACCYGKAGKTDRAFALLDAASAAGFHDPAQAAVDADLSTLHGDARWPTTLTRIKERAAAWEKSLVAPTLRRQLLAMIADDQAAREAWLAAQGQATKAKALGAKVQAGDREHTQALRAAIVKYGWPSRRVVGDDGAHAAWLLAQHADADLPLQKEVLTRMKPLVASGEVAAADYAYLYDRVAVAEHRPQLYGTQFDGAEPFPIADAAHVDERRRAIGLSSLAEYKKLLIDKLGASN